jgi:hypothetical protein
VYNVKSDLSSKVIQSLGGWETHNMVSHFAASLTVEDALALYREKNGHLYMNTCQHIGIPMCNKW